MPINVAFTPSFVVSARLPLACSYYCLVEIQIKVTIMCFVMFYVSTAKFNSQKSLKNLAEFDCPFFTLKKRLVNQKFLKIEAFSVVTPCLLVHSYGPFEKYHFPLPFDNYYQPKRRNVREDWIIQKDRCENFRCPPELLNFKNLYCIALQCGLGSEAYALLAVAAFTEFSSTDLVLSSITRIFYRNTR